MGNLILPVVLLAAMYLLVIRPQQQRMKAQRELMASLEAGDEVVTTGGIYGHIVAMSDDTLTVEIADGVEVFLAKAAVANRVDPVVDADEDEEEPDPDGEEPDPDRDPDAEAEELPDEREDR